MEGGAGRGHSVSRLNVLIAITVTIFGLIYDLGSIASALLFLVPAFDLSTFMTSVVTSAVVLGQLFGALIAGRIFNTSGPKRALALAPETNGHPPEEIRTHWQRRPLALETGTQKPPVRPAAARPLRACPILGADTWC